VLSKLPFLDLEKILTRGRVRSDPLMPSGPFLIPPEMVELFESGVSIMVGTRDAMKVPEATIAAGASVHPERDRLTLFLPTAGAERTLKNLQENGRIAVGFSSPLDHRTLQVKGSVVELRPAEEGEREVVSRYHAAYAEVLQFVGIPRGTLRRLNVWPAFAVTLVPTDLFQQTPGPNAGDRLGTNPKT
jgi:hypothetical protein